MNHDIIDIVICNSILVLYIKYFIVTPQTCQHWPGAGPMLYTKSARCWQNILARHWPGIVCTAARYWPNAGITLYAVTTPLCTRYT